LFIWKNKWSNEEEKILIEHYVDYGAKWVSDKLSRSINTVRIKASYNGLSFNNIDGKYKEIFLVILSLHPIIIKNVLIRLTSTGNNNDTVKKYIKLYNIDVHILYMKIIQRLKLIYVIF
jgi:hypothetical protein